MARTLFWVKDKEIPMIKGQMEDPLAL